MKQIIIMVVAMLCTNNMTVENIKSVFVPDEIRNTFINEFHSATKVKWEIEEGKYEASFTYGNKKMSALYTQQGEKLETETAIPVSSLPALVLKSAAEKGKIKDAAEIAKTSRDTCYEAHIGNKDLLFDKDGNLIKEVND